MISKTAEYALRAMVALRNQGPQGRVLNRDLSKLTKIPQNYLSKIMHALARSGLVVSERGPNGGFRLRRNAGSITAYQIVTLFEDLDGHKRCLLGEKNCRDSTACPAHEGWKAVRETYERYLKETTLDVLAPDSVTNPTADMRDAGSRRGTSKVAS